MDVVLLFNGLGNQMSQYAFYLSKKLKERDCIVIFDPYSKNNHNGLELENVFGLKIKHGTYEKIALCIYRICRYTRIRHLLELFGIKFIYESKNYDYDKEKLSLGNGLINFYWGGWHSELYYRDIKEKIRNSFTFPNIDDKLVSNIRDRILFCNSVSIHVRRGDYLQISKNNPYQLNGVCTMNYYVEAISYIRKKVKSPVFFVFSNDISWCRENFGDNDFEYIDFNKKENSWRDMYLMSLCKHHIIANSTFSWWGAWLSPYNDQIIIRPHKFLKNIITKDIYPTSWIDLNNINKDER